MSGLSREKADRSGGSATSLQTEIPAFGFLSPRMAWQEKNQK
jgi:hypothetical protein